MSAPTSRRGILAGLAAAPALTLPAAASIPSDLAAACAWAMAREAAIDGGTVTAGWSEALWDAEFDACGAVYRRAIAEPSASVADIAAKARLLIPDLARHGELTGDGPLDRLTAVVLREISALGGAA